MARLAANSILAWDGRRTRWTGLPWRLLARHGRLPTPMARASTREFNSKHSHFQLPPPPILAKMISPDSSVFLTQQLEPVVNLCDVGTGAWNLSFHVQRWVHPIRPLDIETHRVSSVSDWGHSGAQVDTSTFSHDTSAQE